MAFGEIGRLLEPCASLRLLRSHEGLVGAMEMRNLHRALHLSKVKRDSCKSPQVGGNLANVNTPSGVPRYAAEVFQHCNRHTERSLSSFRGREQICGSKPVLSADPGFGSEAGMQSLRGFA